MWVFLLCELFRFLVGSCVILPLACCMRTAYFLADCLLRRFVYRSLKSAAANGGTTERSSVSASAAQRDRRLEEETIQRAELCLYDALLRLFMAPRPQRQFLSVSPRLEALYMIFAAINALKRVPLTLLAQLGRESPSLSLLEAVAELHLTVAFAVRKFFPLPLFEDLLFVRDPSVDYLLRRENTSTRNASRITGISHQSGAWR